MSAIVEAGARRGNLDPSAVARLRSHLRGRVVEPRDLGYDEARRVWNGMIDRRPALVVKPTDEVDVQRAVLFCQEQGLPLSVKGGGHNVAGNAVCDGGVMIDLSLMRSIHVDPVQRRARVQGGALWGDVDAATAAHGLATTGGVISSTGVAGLTLGGGIGWLVGVHGMTIDNLRAATVVTPAGEIVTASDTSHPDLVWALRGGGGNFGVVTSFDFAVHPQGDVLAGYVAYPLDQAREVLDFYHELTLKAPDALTAYAQISLDPESGERVIAVAVCWPGDIAEGERVIAPLRAFGTPLVEQIGTMPYFEWQQAFDEEFPHGRRYYWKGSLTRELHPSVLDAMAERASDSELPMCQVVIEWYRGPMNRVDPTATAFAHRDAHYQIVAIGMWEDADDDVTGIGWTRGLHDAVAPWQINGSFLNFNSVDGDEREDRVRAGYGANWDRLREIKRRYDPDNVFARNHNILPATSRTSVST